MKKIYSTILLIAVVVTSGCANQGVTGNKGLIGAGAGAATGAVAGQAIGKNTESTLIGVALGAIAGYIAGNEWDKYDAQMLNKIETTRSGETISWQNPDNGNQYRVTPQPVIAGSNETCRPTTMTAIIDGRTETVHTKSCRQPNGSWKLKA